MVRKVSLSVIDSFPYNEMAKRTENNARADQPQLLDNVGFMAPRVHTCIWTTTTAAICPSQDFLGPWGPALCLMVRSMDHAWSLHMHPTLVPPCAAQHIQSQTWAGQRQRSHALLWQRIVKSAGLGI